MFITCPARYRFIAALSLDTSVIPTTYSLPLPYTIFNTTMTSLPSTVIPSPSSNHRRSYPGGHIPAHCWRFVTVILPGKMSTPFAQVMAKLWCRLISASSYPVVGETFQVHCLRCLLLVIGWPRGSMEDFSASTWAEGGQGISLSDQVAMSCMAVIVGGAL